LVTAPAEDRTELFTAAFVVDCSIADFVAAAPAAFVAAVVA
jgi:hypothetical protein